jgi:hypothetical protein
VTKFVSQLPPSFILLDDFNADNIIWVAVLADGRGRSVYYVCAGFNLILLNTGTHMLLCLGSGTPGLAVNLELSVLSDLHGTDHYPVNLHMSTSSPKVSRHPNWVTRRAD